MKNPITTLTFPTDLPIAQQRETIATALQTHPVIVVAGETGSGKTTQIPKICLSLGRGQDKLIGHTQPRRIAARAVASRLAQELRCELGQQVGYQIRFTDKISQHTYVKVMTDGILLAEIQQDRLLQKYDTLIIDEAHERSLNIDFLLGYLNYILPKRPDLKVIITSATINPQQFSRHFNHAPIIEVAGRTYPVEIWYRPIEYEQAQLDGIIGAIDALRAARHYDDILIFLSSEREIRDTAEALRKQQWPHMEILPLYARLSVAEQNKIFQTHTGTRVVLATNVAETSLTVPGIRYVIDTGYARISRYSYRTKVQCLPIEAISQASANQRKGRCGREAPGICIRLYSEEDFTNRPAFTEPEILRTHLASVILQMAALQLGDIQNFPFLEKPDPRAIRAAYRLLHELQAITPQQALTPLGKQLAHLPLDPKLARMLMAASREGCLAEVLIIVSGLSIQDPRERPHEKQQAADEQHRRFTDDKSDFIAILKLWQHLQQQKDTLSKNQLRKYCAQHFISYLRFQEWGDIYRQLRTQLEASGLRLNSEPANYDAIHRALLTGLLGQIGFKLADHAYLGTRSRHFHIFPGSGLAKKPPQWLMAAELIETSRLYAHTAASITPDWLEELASHLITLHYFGPSWQEHQGYVGAYAKVTLFGLVINPKRKVNYGPIEPQISREIFIREALVNRRTRTKLAFLTHNQQLLAELHELEDKTRRKDIVADEYTVYEFYAKQIPETIHNMAAFVNWYKTASGKRPHLLYLTEADLLRQTVAIATDQWPDSWQLDGVSVPLYYRFEPGHPEDGVTIEIPLPVLNQLPTYRFDWLVPGLLLEKMAALIKILPKQLRRNFIPASEFAKACHEAIEPTDIALHAAMAKHLFKITAIKIPDHAWQFEQLPPHLLMNFKVLDDKNEIIAMGRDLHAIKNKLQGRMQAKIAALPTATIERTHITTWDFGDLPQTWDMQQNTLTIQVFPALVDKQTAVAIELFAEKIQAQTAHRKGLLRLFALASSQPLNDLRKNLPQQKQLALLFTTVGTKEQLVEDLLNAAVQQVFLGDAPLIYQAHVYESHLEQGRTELVTTASEIAELVVHMLTRYVETLRLLNRHPLQTTVNEQLKHLIYPGFISATPYKYLQRFPIYLQAIKLRLTKYSQNPSRDQQAENALKLFWQAYLNYPTKTKPAIIEFRWMLEEYRISLFAQPMKTLVPVSQKRLERLSGIFCQIRECSLNCVNFNKPVV